MKLVQVGNEPDIVISVPSIHDAKEIIDFLNSVGGETDFLTFGANEFLLSIEEEQLIISDCLNLNLCLMLIAKIQNKIVGQLFVQRSNKSRLCHIGDLSISISKKYWGCSIGFKMMISAIEWAKNNGVTKLQLQVRSDNKRAIKLYTRLGFKIEGCISRSLKINNLYFEDYLLGLCF